MMMMMRVMLYCKFQKKIKSYIDIVLYFAYTKTTLYYIYICIYKKHGAKGCGRQREA